MREVILETERLVLRTLEQDDFEEVCKLLQDPVVMYAYEGAFSDQEVQAWLDKMFWRYENDGFALWAVIRRVVVNLSGNVASRIRNITGDGCRKSDICSGKSFGIRDLPRRLPWLVKSMHFKC